MRHLKGYKKLGRDSAHRKAMLRNIATSFLKEGRIKTTVARAKSLRPYVERLITIGKEETVAARRKAASQLFDKNVCQKLFNEIGPRFKERCGGYTRLLKYGNRAGDNAPLCLFELVDFSSNEGKIEEKRRQEKKAKKQAELEKEQEMAQQAPA